MRKKIKVFLICVLVLAAGVASIPAFVLFSGWLHYRSLERSIIDKMDQYYLTVSYPEREEYLLKEDEVFEVPYMASQLSVDASPTRIYDRRGTLIGEFQEVRGMYVRDPADLPDFLKKAIVAAEDGEFYGHHGVDWKSILRAALANLKAGKTVQGGSTLTQQLAKILFTTHERTFGRKVFELFCAKKLEEKFTKGQILMLYLNFVYLGHGCYGVECASRFYFDKPAEAMELGESAMLAGIIASPNNYSPFRAIELSKARHRTVLRRMEKHGFIPAGTAERYSRDFWDSLETRLKAPEASIWRMKVNKAPYFVEHVRRLLEEEFPKDRLMKGGLKVYTTLDLEAQRAAKRSLVKGLQEERAHFSEKNPHDAAATEGGLAAINPADGGILALVGGSEFTYRNQFDRAAGGRRPIGSSIKPFVYAHAIESGVFTATDTVLDAPASYKRGRGETWTPHNYGGRYSGEVSLATALRKSLNTVAVKVLARSDIDNLIRLIASASGAPASVFPRNLTLALGTAELTPLELASAYAIFVNGGYPVRPHAVTRIEDRSGSIIHAQNPLEPSEPLLSSATVRSIRGILESVLQKGGTAYSAARRTGFSVPAAGKTGTTNDYRDAWFAGVTPELSAVVRIGNDNMGVALGAGRSGGRVAAPIWMHFVKEFYAGRPARAFETDIDKRGGIR